MNLQIDRAYIEAMVEKKKAQAASGKKSKKK